MLFKHGTRATLTQAPPIICVVSKRVTAMLYFTYYQKKIFQKFCSKNKKKKISYIFFLKLLFQIFFPTFFYLNIFSKFVFQYFFPNFFSEFFYLKFFLTFFFKNFKINFIFQRLYRNFYSFTETKRTVYVSVLWKIWYAASGRNWTFVSCDV